MIKPPSNELASEILPSWPVQPIIESGSLERGKTASVHFDEELHEKTNVVEKKAAKDDNVLVVYTN